MVTSKKKSVNTKGTSGVKYTGKVTIEKVYNNKVVKKNTIHNVGCLPLFQFLIKCLSLYTGSNAEQTGLFNSKPQYLNAFYQDPAEQVQALQFDGNTRLKSYVKQSSITTKSSPQSTLNDQKNAWSQIDIKFLIQDNNFLYTDSTDVSHQINILAIYSGDTINNENNPHAFIIIEDLAKYLKYESGVNYIITWSLKISN